MPTRRTASPKPQVTHRARPTKVAGKGLLGTRLAQHVVAVARSRIVAAPLELGPTPGAEPVRSGSERASDAEDMHSDTVRELLKRRWHSERPFEGASTEAIVRKLTAGALTAEARSFALRELSRRSYKFQPA